MLVKSQCSWAEGNYLYVGHWRKVDLLKWLGSIWDHIGPTMVHWKKDHCDRRSGGFEDQCDTLQLSSKAWKILSAISIELKAESRFSFKCCFFFTSFSLRMSSTGSKILKQNTYCILSALFMQWNFYACLSAPYQIASCFQSMVHLLTEVRDAVELLTASRQSFSHILMTIRVNVLALLTKKVSGEL